MNETRDMRWAALSSVCHGGLNLCEPQCMTLDVIYFASLF